MIRLSLLITALIAATILFSAAVTRWLTLGELSVDAPDISEFYRHKNAFDQFAQDNAAATDTVWTARQLPAELQHIRIEKAYRRGRFLHFLLEYKYFVPDGPNREVVYDYEGTIDSCVVLQNERKCHTLHIQQLPSAERWCYWLYDTNGPFPQP